MPKKDICLEIKNVTKNYHCSVTGKSRLALQGISLDIVHGEVLSLLGINGAGKTTLSSIVATLHPPTTGLILFNRVSINNDLINYRLSVGFCPQRPNLDHTLTLEQNLYFAGCYYHLPEDLIKNRIQLLVEQFELKKYLQAKADILSGGYKQRFMIARALMHNPKILILDEPTVGLDPHIRRGLWDKIKKLKRSGITVILTTHYLDEAEQLSDRVCVIDQGKVQLIDSPYNLLNKFKKNNLEEVFLALMNENNINKKEV